MRVHQRGAGINGHISYGLLYLLASLGRVQEFDTTSARRVQRTETVVRCVGMSSSGTVFINFSAVGFCDLSAWSGIEYVLILLLVGCEARIELFRLLLVIRNSTCVCREVLGLGFLE